MLKLTINGQEKIIDDVDPEMPLLWLLRDTLGMVGTKYGCGIAQCGACTVHIEGAPMRACQIPAVSVAGKSITTIEGLANNDGKLHALQEAWIAHDVPQCGYCQAGQLMSAAALLKAHPKPTNAQIDVAMAGNLCRCGTYVRIRQAIHTAAASMAATSNARKPTPRAPSRKGGAA